MEPRRSQGARAHDAATTNLALHPPPTASPSLAMSSLSNAVFDCSRDCIMGRARACTRYLFFLRGLCNNNKKLLLMLLLLLLLRAKHSKPSIKKKLHSQHQKQLLQLYHPCGTLPRGP